MSTQQNLDANLSVFTARYGIEKATPIINLCKTPLTEEEVDAILARKPAFDPAAIEIPANIKYPKTVSLCGIVAPDQVKTLLMRKELTETKVVILIDNDPEYLRAVFQRYNLVGMISSTFIHILFGRTEEEWRAELYEVFKVPPATDYFAANLTIYHPNLDTDELSFYKKLLPTFFNMQQMLLSNLGYIDDYLEGIRATAANEYFIRTCPGIQDLKNKYKDKSVFLVGAGPSLDEDLETLKANQDKGIIIAADASVKSLVAAGIRVDFATSIERWVDIQARFWDNLPTESLPELVAFPVVHTDVLRSYKGKIRIPYRNYAYYIHWEKLVPHGILHSFSNTMHLGFRLARYMGCNKFIMIGMDNCYKHVEGTTQYISHAKNPGFPEWGDAHERADIIKNQDYYAPFFDVSTNAGTNTLCNRIYQKWADEWTQEAAVLNLGDSIVNTAKLGIQIKKIQYKPLSEVVAELPIITPLPESTWQPADYQGSFEYELLFKNINAYKNLYIKLKNELAGLGKIGFKDIQGIRFYGDVVNTYMRKDPFQMSWITQNCTREMSLVLNKLAILSEDPQNDTKEEWSARLSYLMEQLDIFISICEKIQNSITKGVEDGQQILQQGTGKAS